MLAQQRRRSIVEAIFLIRARFIRTYVDRCLPYRPIIRLQENDGIAATPNEHLSFFLDRIH